MRQGASVAAVARTEAGGYLALLSPTEGHADRLPVLGVRGSAGQGPPLT